MTATIAFACGCGTVRGHLEPGDGARVVCHCRDCRAAEVALGQPDPGAAGVDLYQTTPDRVRFEAGQDRLALLRLSPKGLMRWHAACCGTPLFNTAPRPGIPFASLHAGRVADPSRLGRVRGHINGGRTSALPLLGLIAGIFARTLSGRLSGRWRQTPFFDVATGAPAVPPRVLTADERRAVTPAA